MKHYTLEEKKINRRAWKESLLMEAFEQGRGFLCSEFGGKFCCLGVLALIRGVSVEEMGCRIDLTNFPEVMNSVGLLTSIGDFTSEEGHSGSLADMNDSGFTFKQIAAIIEEEPNGLFG